MSEAATSAEIVECVPNFSEGKRPEVIAEIVAAAQAAAPLCAALPLFKNLTHTHHVLISKSPEMPHDNPNPPSDSELGNNNSPAIADRVPAIGRLSSRRNVNTTEYFVAVVWLLDAECSVFA